MNSLEWFLCLLFRAVTLPSAVTALTPMPWSVDASSSGNPLAVAFSSTLIRLPRVSGDSLFPFFPPSDGGQLRIGGINKKKDTGALLVSKQPLQYIPYW
jgi:hypothetical protein